MNMGMRLAGMGKLTGMTEADVMALATTMSSLGIEAEAGERNRPNVVKAA